MITKQDGPTLNSGKFQAHKYDETIAVSLTRRSFSRARKRYEMISRSNECNNFLSVTFDVEAHRENSELKIAITCTNYLHHC